jgi:hypothetical protein
MRIDEIFRTTPANDIAPHIKGVKGKDGKIVPKNDELAALADATRGGMKFKSRVTATGKVPERK